MKNNKLYEKTINILIDAYHKDTLVHGNCYACAVGNIIAANCGYEFEKDSRVLPVSSWSLKWVGFDGYMTPRGVYDTGTYYSRNNHMNEIIPEPVRRQIEATGYTREELKNIEYAFEHAFEHSIYSSNDSMFDGLMAVVDVLDKIHENNDSFVTKQRFVKAKEVVSV